MASLPFPPRLHPVCIPNKRIPNKRISHWVELNGLEFESIGNTLLKAYC